MEISDDIQRILHQLREYDRRGLKLFSTSSFQTHSIPMLHIISLSDLDIPVYFLDTGFHFPETLQFRNEVRDSLNLNVINIASPVPKVAQRDGTGSFLYTSDPDRCCFLNKVLPLEPILQSHDVWINGVRKDQTAFRNSMKAEEPGAFDTLQYRPMLDWTSKQIWEHRKEYHLPEHPLDAKGYLSIGCVPCTRKFDPEKNERGGRWAGMTKEECGIHTEFAVSGNQ